MTQQMKILGLRLSNYRQFKNFYLDLTASQSKEALNNVCLIGANGTGKSTILYVLSHFFKHGDFDALAKGDVAIAMHLEANQKRFWVFSGELFPTSVLPEAIVIQNKWDSIFTNTASDKTIRTLETNFFLASQETDQESLWQKIKLASNSNDLAIYAPADGKNMLPDDLPQTTLDRALGLFNNFKAFHLCSFEQIQDFWNVLIYQIKKREHDFQIHLDSPDIQKLTVAEAREQFNRTHPEILSELANQWKLILEKAGLSFDIENAKIPVQTTENLQAYIKSTSTGKAIPYNSLSTGIRNFIFRLGYIYSLYFSRRIERGFLLVDEPEASLFPDLLYDIIERYQSITENTQFFAATQSPIIAAQFKPEERIILEFDAEHYVTCRRGISPEGDDPNDLLLNDFLVRSLYGKKGVEQWNRYLELRRLIPNVEDVQEKRKLLTEYARIGNTYNFIENEIPG